MSKYQKKFGCNTSGLSAEAHRVCGQTTCKQCGTVVAVNQDGLMFGHDEPRNPERFTGFCQQSLKKNE
jgi:hypothetical protein